jgi:hypothetical protein
MYVPYCDRTTEISDKEAVPRTYQMQYHEKGVKDKYVTISCHTGLSVVAGEEYWAGHAIFLCGHAPTFHKRHEDRLPALMTIVRFIGTFCPRKSSARPQHCEVGDRGRRECLRRVIEQRRAGRVIYPRNDAESAVPNLKPISGVDGNTIRLLKVLTRLQLVGSISKIMW